MSTTYSELQIKAALTALNIYHEKPFVKHQWEELVFHLCHNDDPEMRERMNREMDVILEKEPGLDVFRIH